MREIKVIDFKVVKTLYSDNSYVQTMECHGDVIHPRTSSYFGAVNYDEIAEMRANTKRYKVLQFQTRVGMRYYGICLDEAIGEIPFLEAIIKEKVMEFENIPKKCVPCDIKQTKNMLKQALENSAKLTIDLHWSDLELKRLREKYDRTFLRVIQRFFKYLLAKEGE